MLECCVYVILHCELIQTFMDFLFSFCSSHQPIHTGLAASCETLLLSEMSVVSVKPIILNADNGLMYNNTLYAIANDRNANNNKSNHRNSSASSTGPGQANANTTSGNMDKSKTSNHQPIIYKFFVPRDVDVVGLRFNIVRACNQCQAIVIHVQADALPTPKNYIHSVVIYANKTSENIVDFYPHQNAWHYIEIGFLNRSKDSDGGSSSTTTAPATTIGIAKAFKSKARLEKKLQFMENNIFVNFSIGLQLINEIQPVVESSENEPNENKSTAAASSANSNKNDSIPNRNGNTGSENENRSVNTSNSNSSSFLDQNPNQAPPTTASSASDADADDFDADDNDIDSKASAKLSAKPRNINYYSLLRSTYREFFMFDYDLFPDENGTVPTFINLTAGIPTGFRFDVGNVFDIGGTLSFAVVMKDNLHDATLAAAAAASATSTIVKTRNRISSNMAVAEKLVHINDELNDAPGHELAEEKANNANGIDRMNFELNHSNEHDDDDDGPDSSSGSNQTIIICIHLNAAAMPKWPNLCVYGQHVFPAASIMNNTNEETSTGLVHIPFPEPGKWYVTLGLFCHGAETSRITIIDSVKEFIKKYVDHLHDVRVPCACANRTDYYQKCVSDARCLSEMSESETLKVKECLMDAKCTNKHKDMARKFEQHHRYATEQSVATDSTACNASAVFTISSSPCVAGRCGRYDR